MIALFNCALTYCLPLLLLSIAFQLLRREPVIVARPIRRRHLPHRQLVPPFTHARFFQCYFVTTVPPVLICNNLNRYPYLGKYHIACVGGDINNEAPKCLNAVGIAFTYAITYTGFLLLAIGTPPFFRFRPPNFIPQQQQQLLFYDPIIKTKTQAAVWSSSASHCLRRNAVERQHSEEAVGGSVAVEGAEGHTPEQALATFFLWSQIRPCVACNTLLNAPPVILLFVLTPPPPTRLNYP